MKKVAATLAVLTAAAASIARPAAADPPLPVIVQGPALTPGTFHPAATTLICKGGATRVPQTVGAPKVVAALGFTFFIGFDSRGPHMTSFEMTFVQATVPARADGSGLRNGECGYADRAMTKTFNSWSRLADENLTGTPVQMRVNMGPTTHVSIGESAGGGVYSASSAITIDSMTWANEASGDGKVFTVPLKPNNGSALAVATGQKPTMR
jgi:hypothetical protein